MKLRAAFWKLHRWIGLACALPFAVLAVTGTGLLLCHALGVGSAPRLDRPAMDMAGVDIALAAIRAGHGQAPAMILPSADTGHAWLAMVRGRDGREMMVAFDPDQGSLFAARPAGSTMRETLLAIHNSLLMGFAGKIAALLTSIAAIMLAITGFAILRRRLRILARAPWRGPSPAAALHKWAGLAGFLFLVLWAASGFLLLGFKMLGEASRAGPPRSVAVGPAPENARAPLRLILENALAHHPGTELQGVMPGTGKRPVMVMLLDRNAAPWNKSRAVSFDAQSGVLLPARPAPAFMKMMIAAKSLHTGLWDGALMLAFYLLVALLPLALVLTGPWLWWRRRPVKGFFR